MIPALRGIDSGLAGATCASLAVVRWPGEAAPATAATRNGTPAHRHGIAESGTDYALGDAFPHDVLLDQNGGVGLRKGCYVGQEVVSRMQHRGTARRRVLIVSGRNRSSAFRHGHPRPETAAGTLGTSRSARARHRPHRPRQVGHGCRARRSKPMALNCRSPFRHGRGFAFPEAHAEDGAEPE
jgi:folate-binding protein YgfZ